MIRYLFLWALLFSALSSPARADFSIWVENFRDRAIAEGIDPSIFDRAFADINFNPAIVKADRHQPEFIRPIWKYLDSVLSSRRIRRGRNEFKNHAGILARIAEQTGVDPAILVAIWGAESSYGASLGKYNVFESLATLGYDGRRARFSERELLAALRIVYSEGIEPDQMVGSWAGAMGHTQFIPSSYLHYAVDFDDNGRRDLWAKNPADALASTANYLARNGWVSGQPWGIEVQLPQSFDFRLAGKQIRRTPQIWRNNDVRQVNGDPLPDWQYGTLGSILTPAGARGPAFLVLTNFYALLSYNNATSYALAVAYLAERIQGDDRIQASWPREDRTLRAEEINELQQTLTGLGYDSGGIDGITGPATRAAVRKFQESIGTVPDGYVSSELLDFVRQAASLKK